MWPRLVYETSGAYVWPATTHGNEGRDRSVLFEKDARMREGRVWETMRYKLPPPPPPPSLPPAFHHYYAVPATRRFTRRCACSSRSSSSSSNSSGSTIREERTIRRWNARKVPATPSPVPPTCHPSQRLPLSFYLPFEWRHGNGVRDRSRTPTSEPAFSLSRTVLTWEKTFDRSLDDL